MSRATSVIIAARSVTGVSQTDTTHIIVTQIGADLIGSAMKNKSMADKQPHPIEFALPLLLSSWLCLVVSFLVDFFAIGSYLTSFFEPYTTVQGAMSFVDLLSAIVHMRNSAPSRIIFLEYILKGIIKRAILTENFACPAGVERGWFRRVSLIYQPGVVRPGFGR